MAVKYVFVTGGVVSGLGKGITAASLGRLLKARGFKVTMQKFDPYINIDPGTMNPIQHGEVFVTDDGAETDLDLGHYERFIDESLNKNSNVTTGKVYWSVLQKERRGDFGGGTVGGSLSGIMASYSLKDFLGNFKGVGLAFKDPKYDHGATISKIIELSNVARKEGLLALEEVAQNLDDEFMKKGILLIVDGTEPELVRGILETELMNMDERHRSVAGFFEAWAALGPAWGMIGTLIGLVNMLKDLTDSSAIGPNMATALLTTLYGSLIANWFCTPIANKLKAQNATEYQLREIVIEGLLSIQAGENPRVIEEKLKSFLSPATRTAISTEEGGGEA